MAANALDLTTLSNVKNWMKMANSENDDDLARLITSASVFAQKWMNRTIASTAYVERRDGHGGTGMILSEQPVISVASIVIDGTTIPTTSYTTSRHGIYLTSGRFTRDKNNVVISYTAGYAATPFDIEQAVIETVSLRWHEHFRIGQSGKSIAGETISFIINEFSPSALAIFKQYKKVVPI